MIFYLLQFFILLILFIYKFGIKEAPFHKEEIAKKIGVSVGSVSWRIGNFKAIEGFGKASHYAKLAKLIYDQYSNYSKFKLYDIAFNKFN